MQTNQSEAFVRQAVIKLLTREQRTMREVVQELDQKRGSEKRLVTQPIEKRRQDWSSFEQLQALNETHVL